MALSAMSIFYLNISRDGDTATSPGSPFWCLMTLSVKKFFLMSNINLPWCSLRGSPLILSFAVWEKRLTRTYSFLSGSCKERKVNFDVTLYNLQVTSQFRRKGQSPPYVFNLRLLLPAAREWSRIKLEEGKVKMASLHIQKRSEFITCSASITYHNGKFFYMLDGRGRGADEKLSLLTKHREVSTAR